MASSRVGAINRSNRSAPGHGLASRKHSVYNGLSSSAPTRLPETSPNSPRRWTVIASGILLFAIALVVIYSGSIAFHSPVAVVVLAAIGLAAVLLQLRLRKDTPQIHVPQWLNVTGIVFAFAALFADRLRLRTTLSQAIALCAVGCFAISSVVVLDRIRRSRPIPPK